MAGKIYARDLLDDAFKPKNDMLTVPVKNIPSVADVIGRTLPMIGKYNDLGYQAIDNDPVRARFASRPSALIE